MNFTVLILQCLALLYSVIGATLSRSQTGWDRISPSCKDVSEPGWSIERLQNLPYDSWPLFSCIVQYISNNSLPKLISKFSPNLYHAASKGFLGFVQYYATTDGAGGLCERSDDNPNMTPTQIAITNQRLNVLQYVATQTHLDLVNCLLDDENFSNSTDDFKEEVFRMAAKSGDLRVLTDLIENKKAFTLDLNRDDDANALLTLTGLTNSVDYYRQEATSLGVNAITLLQSRLLNRAVVNGNVGPVRFLVDTVKFDVNLKDEYGWSAAHCAAFWGSYTMLRYLTEVEGADLNITTGTGNTLLHSAASAHGSVLVVKYLVLDKSVNINQRNYLDQTPLYFAVWNGHFGIVVFLTGTKKADLYVKDSPNKRNLLHRAALSGHTPVLKYLIDELKMASHLNETEKHGFTVAMNAARCMNRKKALPILKYLVDKKQATTAGVTSLGLDILMVAADEKNPSVVRYLVEEKGFDLYKKCTHGYEDYVGKSAYDMLEGHSCAGRDCEWLKGYVKKTKL